MPCPDPTPRALVELVHRLGPRWIRWSASQIPRDGLHPARLRVLRVLVDNGPTPMRELARRTETSAANVSKLVTEMEADGLVMRERDPADARVLHATATPLGATALREAWDSYVERVATVFTDMPEATRAQVAMALEALLAALPER